MLLFLSEGNGFVEFSHSLKVHFNLFRSLRVVVFVNFSHVCSGKRKLPGWKRKASPPVFSPRSPPLAQLSTPRRSEAEQTAVQTPQIITQESHWERCVGSGDDSVCAPVFTDIHLHMSWPQPITRFVFDLLFFSFFFLFWFEENLTQLWSHQIRLYLHSDKSFT